MALSITNIANLLFKGLQGKSSTNDSRQFFEEPRDGRIPIFPSQIWSQAGDIPTTAPVLADQAISGVVQYWEDLSLTAVPGVSNSFSSDNLIDAIPFNFGDGSYNYVLKDSLGSSIAFGQGDWIVDNATGTLTFYGTVPSNMPPQISFYKYVGAKATNGTGNFIETVDSTSSGSLSAYDPATNKIVFTGAVTDIAGIVNRAAGFSLIINNQSGGTISILNEDAGETPADRIITGTGQNLDLEDDASILLNYSEENDRWNVVGGTGSGAGGAGSLENIFQDNADADGLVDYNTGNDPFFNLGGLMTGTLTHRTTTPINGLGHYRFTQFSGSDEDYVVFPTITLTPKMLGQKAKLRLTYLYDGADGDIEIKYLVDANPVIESHPLKNATTAITEEFNIDIPSAGTSLYVGFQVAVENIGAILDFDDIAIDIIPNNTILKDVDVKGIVSLDEDEDSTTTGSAQTLVAPATGVLTVTNASLETVTGISGAKANQTLLLVNQTGRTITLLNESGTAANQIVTGEGQDSLMADGSSVWLYYGDNTKWNKVGNNNVNIPLVNSLGTETWTNTSGSTCTVTLQRMGQYLYVEGYVDMAGAFADTELNVIIPSAYAADSSWYQNIGTTRPIVGSASLSDAGAPNFATCILTTATVIRIQVNNASSTYSVGANLTSTVPFTWNSSDFITFNAMFKVAAWTQNTISGLAAQSTLETLSTTSSTKTPSATNVYAAMTGASLTLKAGKTYEVEGSMLFSSSGGNPTYSYAYLGWFAANGADTASIPATLSTLSTIQILSSPSYSDDNSTMSREVPAATPFTVNTLPLKVRAISDTTIYLVPIAGMTSPTLARFIGYLNAFEVPFSTTSIAIAPDAELHLDTGNGLGSTATVIRRFTNINKNTLEPYATYADSATQGATVTVNITGNYIIEYGDHDASAAQTFGISVNSVNNGTSVVGLTYAQGKRAEASCAIGGSAQCSATLYLQNGDVIRPHTNGSISGTTNRTIFKMKYLG